MKKNTIYLLSSLLLISIIGVFSCVPKVEDDDIITGKWIDTKILLDTTSTECQKNSYIEFSEYGLTLQERIYTQYHACTEIEEFETEGGTETRTVPPHTVKIGNYTINGDTLTVKDVENQTKIYVIGGIDSEKMTLETLDRDGNIQYMFYKRYNK